MTRLALPLLLSLGCSSSHVTNGYPPLTTGCQITADCGGAYQCLDGGCEILACDHQEDCPAGFGCGHAIGESHGQCLLCIEVGCDGGVDAGVDGGTDGGIDGG